MIIWIAGWPQSGSALCRNLIEQTLEFPTYSRYYEPQLEFMFGAKCSLFIEQWNVEKYLELREQQERVTLIKTHGYEPDNSATIYLLRDGRNAIAGLSRFWSKPINTIITGEDSFPYMDWSTHFKVWQPYNRPNTLIIKFEEMLANPDATARVIAKALNVPVKNKFRNDMSEYRKRWPQLFKPRHSDWRVDFSEQDTELFWRLHRDTMIAAGYGDRDAAENR